MKQITLTNKRPGYFNLEGYIHIFNSCLLTHIIVEFQNWGEIWNSGVLYMY